jgi:hypothetical protein
MWVDREQAKTMDGRAMEAKNLLVWRTTAAPLRLPLRAPMLEEECIPVQ